MKVKRFYKRAYLMVAYSHEDHEERARVADITAAYLMEVLKLAVFSPISQSHRVAAYVNAGHLSHEFWLGQDLEFMQVCEVGVLLVDDYYKKSFGVAWELGWFEAKSIEVVEVGWGKVVDWAKRKGIEVVR